MWADISLILSTFILNILAHGAKFKNAKFYQYSNSSKALNSTHFNLVDNNNITLKQKQNQRFVLGLSAVPFHEISRLQNEGNDYIDSKTQNELTFYYQKPNTSISSKMTSKPVRVPALAQCSSINIIYSKIKAATSVPNITSFEVYRPCNDEPDSAIINQKQNHEDQSIISANPLSIFFTYKNLFRNSLIKKYVSEDRLAFGHRQYPSNGQISEDISKIAEEKLFNVKKPVIEFNPFITLGNLMDLNLLSYISIPLWKNGTARVLNITTDSESQIVYLPQK